MIFNIFDNITQAYIRLLFYIVVVLSFTFYCVLQIVIGTIGRLENWVK